MKKILTLIIGLVFVLSSCVSLNPSTKSFPVTGDVLETTINGIPYNVLDEYQHYRSKVNASFVPADDYLWIDVDKKGNWYIVTGQTLVSKENGVIKVDETTPPSESALKVFVKDLKYSERPWRRN